MKKLLKSTRPNRQYPRVPSRPEVDLDFRGHLNMVALRNSAKWIPWPQRRWEWRNYLLRKVSILLYSPSKCWLIYRKPTFDLLKVKVLDRNQVLLICPLPLDNALPISYCASKSVWPFGFCRYISSWKSRCLRLCLKKHGEILKIFVHFEVP